MVLKIEDVETALQIKLKALTPGWTMAYEGVPFTPSAASPWQRGTLMLARPFAAAFSKGSHNRQRGIFQVDLFYMTSAADTRSQLFKRATMVRDWFYPTDRTKIELTSNQTNVIIEDMPAIRQIIAGSVHNQISVDVFIRLEDSPA